MLADVIEEATAAIRGARHIAVLTGAGISAESGIPTFRDAMTGLWAKFSPEELATADAYRRNPTLVWTWYAWRRELVAKAAPNAGHRALASLQKQVPRFTLITQNVDGLHTRAGSNDVIELHGNIMHNLRFDDRSLVDDADLDEQVPPRCKRTGQLVRPGVVWFGESLPPDALETAWRAAAACDVFLSIGTSTVVEPAASLPFMARDHGAIIIEINPSSTPLTPHARLVLPGNAADILPRLAGI